MRADGMLSSMLDRGAGSTTSSCQWTIHLATCHNLCHNQTQGGKHRLCLHSHNTMTVDGETIPSANRQIRHCNHMSHVVSQM